MIPAAEEIVIIVNRENNVVDALPRSVMRDRKLIHRAAYILVFNDENKLFIQKRSSTKDVYPGYWDIAAGGVVLAGESYLAAAHRELREELGIDGLELIHRFNHFYEDKENMVWGSIYSCIHNGPFNLQEEEIDEGRFIDIPKIKQFSDSEPVIPDGLEILQLLDDETEGNKQ